MRWEAFWVNSNCFSADSNCFRADSNCFSFIILLVLEKNFFAYFILGYLSQLSTYFEVVSGFNYRCTLWIRISPSLVLIFYHSCYIIMIVNSKASKALILPIQPFLRFYQFQVSNSAHRKFIWKLVNTVIKYFCLQQRRRPVIIFLLKENWSLSMNRRLVGIVIVAFNVHDMPIHLFTWRL